MNLAPLLEQQIRIQREAIASGWRWTYGLVLGGFGLIALQWLVGLGGNAGGALTKAGGAFVGMLSALPYREIVARKERLATYSFLLRRFREYNSLSTKDQDTLLSLANKALEETLKR